MKGTFMLYVALALVAFALGVSEVRAVVADLTGDLNTVLDDGGGFTTALAGLPDPTLTPSEMLNFLSGGNSGGHDSFLDFLDVTAAAFGDGFMFFAPKNLPELRTAALGADDASTAVKALLLQLSHHLLLGNPADLNATLDTTITGAGDDADNAKMIQTYPATLRPLQNANGDDADPRNPSESTSPPRLQFKVLSIDDNVAKIQTGTTSQTQTIPTDFGAPNAQGTGLGDGVVYFVNPIDEAFEVQTSLINVLRGGGDSTAAFRAVLVKDAQQGSPITNMINGKSDFTLLLPPNADMARLITDNAVDDDETGKILQDHIIGIGLPAELLRVAAAKPVFEGNGLPNGNSPDPGAGQFTYTSFDQDENNDPDTIVVGGRTFVQKEFVITTQGNVHLISGVIGYTPPEVEDSGGSAPPTVVGIVSLLVTSVAAVLFI